MFLMDILMNYNNVVVVEWFYQNNCKMVAGELNYIASFTSSDLKSISTKLRYIDKYK